MKILKKTLSVALAAVLLLGVLPAVAAAAGPTFTDVYEDDWFVEDVAYVYQNGLMSGTGNDTFAPETAMTRGMLVTILHRMEGTPIPVQSVGFVDVADNAYYADAVAWAAELKLVLGHSDTIFAPDDAITREQMAVILYRYATYKGYDVSARSSLTAFSDWRDVSAYAEEALSWTVHTGLINGYGGALKPQGSATRSQAAAILHRFCVSVAERSPAANRPEFTPNNHDAKVLEELENVSFVFASGAGGWATTLTIRADGSFSGEYHDSEMGMTGPGYPNGSVYTCSFSGSFDQVDQIFDGLYTMTLTSLTYDQEPGETWIENGIQYIADDAYGLNDGEVFYLYRPGVATAKLPDAYIEWVSMPNAWGSNIPETLPFWGLYNVGGQMGFYGEEQ